MYSDKLIDILRAAVKAEKLNAIEQHGYFKTLLEGENAFIQELSEFLLEANQAQKLFSNFLVRNIAAKNQTEYIFESEEFEDLKEVLLRALIELIQVHAVVDKIHDFRVDE